MYIIAKSISSLYCDQETESRAGLFRQRQSRFRFTMPLVESFWPLHYCEALASDGCQDIMWKKEVTLYLFLVQDLEGFS